MAADRGREHRLALPRRVGPAGLRHFRRTLVLLGHSHVTRSQGLVEGALTRGEVEPVEVMGVDGKPRRSMAFPGVIDAAQTAPEPTKRLRVLSPFDPALRDCNRAERLFGFHYRIEIFVPAA